MPSRNCTSIFNLSKLNLLALFGSDPMDSLYICEKERESCIYPSPSFTLFSLVTLAVGNVKNGRGRGGCAAHSAPYRSKQNQAERQEIASCILQPGLPLLSLSHRRAALTAVSLPHCSAEASGFICSALLQEKRSKPGAGPLPASAHCSHRTDPDVPSWATSSSFQNKKTCHSKQ